ncbi:MAG: hypothetical protein LW669_09385 [Sphingobacteriales bacterium]|nr:hypothetical protein [Sphingobacteriales bacterium]
MKRIIGIVLLLTFFAACYRDKEELLYPNDFGGGDTSALVTYSGFVQPLVATRCVKCHAGFGSYAGLKIIVDNGKFADRVLVKKDMPSGGTLNTAQLAKLDRWVKAGAPNN